MCVDEIGRCGQSPERDDHRQLQYPDVVGTKLVEYEKPKSELRLLFKRLAGMSQIWKFDTMGA